MYLPNASREDASRLHSKTSIKDLECSFYSGSASPPSVERRQSQQAWACHPENPFNWSETKKWRTALTAAAVVFLIGLNTTAIATASHQVTARFNVDDSAFPNDVWPITAWNTGAAFGPMVGMPLLESFGIRKGYVVN